MVKNEGDAVGEEPNPTFLLDLLPSPAPGAATGTPPVVPLLRKVRPPAAAAAAV